MNFLISEKNYWSGVTYHRLRVPFEHIAKKYGYGVVFYSRVENIPDAKYDVAVFNRSFGFGDQDIEWINELKQRGVLIVMDIDDYWELPEHHTIRWRKDINYDIWKANIISNMRFADMFWTTNRELQLKIKKYAGDRPVHIVNNALDWDNPMWTTSKPFWDKKEKVNIGYVGGTTHYNDLTHLKGVLKLFNKYYGKKVIWRQCGFDNVSDYGKRVSNQIYNVFSCDGKYAKYVRAHGGVRHSMYAHFYDGLDISIAPLHDNPFNECKSELKVLEAGAKKIPFIGQDLATYNRCGAEIDLCDTGDEWFESLKELTLDQDLRKRLGEELHEYTREMYRIDVENEKRLKSIEGKLYNGV